MRRVSLWVEAAAAALLAACASGTGGYAPQVARDFADPPRDCSIVPYWFLNGKLEKAELERQLGEMRAQGVTAAFLHARTGLATPYLEEPWWEAIGHVLAAARDLGLRMWIYDEYNWPSGSAMRRVPRQHPDFQQRGLAVKEVEASGPATARVPWPVRQVFTGGEYEPQPRAARDEYAPVVAAVLIRKNPDGSVDPATARDVSGRFAGGSADAAVEIPEGMWKVMVFYEQADLHCWSGFEGRTNVLDIRAVRAFLDSTHEQYRRRFPGALGDVIPAAMDDETSLCWPAWTTDFLDDFRAKKGYDLRLFLPALWHDAGKITPKVRADYYGYVADRFATTYFGTINAWAKARGMKTHAQPLLEESLAWHAWFYGDTFRVLREVDIPGADVIVMPGRRCHSIVVKGAASVAHLTGRNEVGVENFAGFGWGLSLEEQKWQANWLYANGATLLIPHAFWYGAIENRGEDYPPSTFLGNPYWRNYRAFADTCRRTQYMLAGAAHVPQVAVLYPIASAWAAVSAARPQDLRVEGKFPTVRGMRDGGTSEVEVLNDAYWRLAEHLVRERWPYDLVDERAIQESGVAGGAMRVGELEFRALVLPPTTTLSRRTMAKIAEFARSGGTVVGVKELPSASTEEGRGDAMIAQGVREVFGFGPEAGAAAPGGARVQEHQRADGGRSYFVPQEPEWVSAVLEQALGRDIAFQGEAQDVYADHYRNRGVDFYYVVNDSEAPRRVRALLRADGEPVLWDPETGTPRLALAYARAHPLISTVSGRRVTDVTLGLEPYQGVFVVFQSGGLGLHEFQSDFDRIEAVESYGNGIRVQGLVRGPRAATVAARKLGNPGESRRVGGRALPPVVWLEGAWRFAAEPMPELPPRNPWPATLPGGKGELPLGSWPDLGLAGYSGHGAYEKTFILAPEHLARGVALELDLGDVREVAEVFVNGRRAGVRAWRPWRLEITPYVKEGENALRVVVSNSAANAWGHLPKQQSMKWADERHPGGLIGPVRVIPAARLEVVLKP